PLGGLRKTFQPKGDDDDTKDVRSIVVIDSPLLMPTSWFGYQGADVAILSTGNSKFLQGLRRQETALQALSEWVRRGGKLVLSVGRNFQEVRELLPLLGIPDFTLEKTERLAA